MASPKMHSYLQRIKETGVELENKKDSDQTTPMPFTRKVLDSEYWQSKWKVDESTFQSYFQVASEPTIGQDRPLLMHLRMDLEITEASKDSGPAGIPIGVAVSMKNPDWKYSFIENITDSFFKIFPGGEPAPEQTGSIVRDAYIGTRYSVTRNIPVPSKESSTITVHCSLARDYRTDIIAKALETSECALIALRPFYF